jgi:hypothetical protein
MIARGVACGFPARCLRRAAPTAARVAGTRRVHVQPRPAAEVQVATTEASEGGWRLPGLIGIFVAVSSAQPSEPPHKRCAAGRWAQCVVVQGGGTYGAFAETAPATACSAD